MNFVSRRKMLQMVVPAALAPAAMAAVQAAEHAAGQSLDQVPDLPPTVSRVYPGEDGKLVYTADEQGNTIPDFSHAGYAGGGVPIPTVPVKETVWPVAGDNTANLQAAIDRVSALPLDKNGFRGTILIKMGYYKMAQPITIQASGVVLRGEGMGDTGTILIGTGNPRANAPGGPGRGQPTLVKIAGTAGWVTKDDTRQAVTDDYVPVGTRTIRVASARAFKPGDTVIVRRIGNQDWIDAMGMGSAIATPGNRWRPFNVDWDRVVVDVQGNTLTIDAPITCAIEKKWGGGEVLKYDDPGRIEKVGIENLRGMSEFNPTVRTKDYGNMDRPNYSTEEYYADEDHYWNFITFDNIRGGWVRNVTALHFVYSMVGTQRGAKWITIQDCVSREPVSRRMGARRFVFGLRGELTLVQRCHSDKGRHSFMMGQPTSTSNVYLDCVVDQPLLLQRDPRTVGHRWPLRQCPRASHRPLLEGHQHRLGRRQYRLLELRRSVPGAETAHRAELLLRPHRRRFHRLQHCFPGPHQRRRLHRIDRHPRLPAQPLSHPAPRPPRRRRRAQHRCLRPAHLTPAARSICSSVSSVRDLALLRLPVSTCWARPELAGRLRPGPLCHAPGSGLS